MSESKSKSSALFVCEAGSFRTATMDETIQAARSALALKFRRGRSLASPRLMREYLQFQLSEREHEVFCVVLMDKRHRLLACLEMFRGTIDGASVHPREVIKEALKYNAAAVAFAHNHPSGIAEPSRADELITTRLKEALALVDIRVLDHIVIGGEGLVSMAERGAL
jgi:DNA repair protein RadC